LLVRTRAVAAEAGQTELSPEPFHVLRCARVATPAESHCRHHSGSRPPTLLIPRRPVRPGAIPVPLFQSDCFIPDARAISADGDNVRDDPDSKNFTFSSDPEYTEFRFSSHLPRQSLLTDAFVVLREPGQAVSVRAQTPMNGTTHHG
jgi:hypothetical protein